jgi:hypothetical protein
MRYLLNEAGFSDARKVDELPYGLQDQSRLRDTMFGTPMALNVEATR